ncbi:hypothetical protein [Leptolyngbya sp. KIOST-1]|uniref:hypothetical protein n=1 Tax=Leptolyngbya sp. KIOST-1 TaxID=1229172 RepID=UPI0012E064AD|nr:hypothetical protein [Leptolyngbya sp. KIOST-1]
MASPQDLSRFSSKDDLLTAVDYLIDVEFSRTGSPWISRQTLCELFSHSYGFDLEELADFRSLGKDLKHFLSSSQRFAFYNRPQPTEYYIALRRVIFPDLLKSGSPAPRLRRGPH